MIPFSCNLSNYKLAPHYPPPVLVVPDWLPCCRLLFRHFSQRQEVLRSFGQVQLLVSDSDVKSYKQIKDDLDDLRLLVEKSELWVYKAVKQEDKKVGDEKLYWTRFAVK